MSLIRIKVYTSLKTVVVSITLCIGLSLLCCSSDEPQKEDPAAEEEQPFYFGADLSYVNQVVDHNGLYKEGGVAKDPYAIFKSHGANVVRLRLWHNPVWTKEVYGAQGTQLYNDLKDVARAMTLAKAQGMDVLLDFHYSDTWADPGKQFIPAAWKDIRSIAILRDSVYNYTAKTLQYLASKGLMPALVQLGNETNCGMLYSEAPAGFPACNVCNDAWQNIGEVLNAGIRAVRDVSAGSAVKTRILLHVADPKNVEWWFDNIKARGSVTDFDMVGFSYYPLWHTTVALNDISVKVAGFKTRYAKEVMILETAYPWTTAAADNYNNQFGNNQPLGGFPFTPQGQYDFLKMLTTEVKEGGGQGLVYWEPAWISANIKDLWGTGSSWENCTFFEFNGNVHKGIEFMRAEY